MKVISAKSIKIRKFSPPLSSAAKINTKKQRTRRKNKVATYKLLKASWQYQGKIFFAESTLHGVRYIAESERPLIERLMWFVCVLIGAISTMVIIVSLWEKFQTNPTITGLDTDFHNWDIPFPAITICPNQPWNESKVDEFVANLAQENGIDQDEEKVQQLTELVTSLTQLSFVNMPYFATNSSVGGLLNDEDLKLLTYKLMTSCEDLFYMCDWKTAAYNCCTGFFPVYTEGGFCYSFNSRHYEAEQAMGGEYPPFHMRFIKETDPKWALKFYLQDYNYTEKFNISIYLHNSDEIPGMDLKPQHVWDFKVERLQFSMRETYTTENAKQLSIKQRHCIFDHEVKLRIDDIYTYTACTQQCRMENAKKLCGCVPHFYKATNQYRYCKLPDLYCVAKNLDTIESVDNCDCELGCSNTIYEVDKLTESALKNADDDQPEVIGSGEYRKNLNQLDCEFTSWPMIKYKREVLFGWVDLLVSFGGIAGLFLGFSLLSGVELVYYFTIRACCMLYKQRDELTEMVLNPKTKEQKDYDLSMVPYFIKDPQSGQGQEFIRQRFKEKEKQMEANQFKTQKIQTIMVKPMNPTNLVVPPFNIDYTN